MSNARRAVACACALTKGIALVCACTSARTCLTKQAYNVSAAILVYKPRPPRQILGSQGGLDITRTLKY